MKKWFAYALLATLVTILIVQLANDEPKKQVKTPVETETETDAPRAMQATDFRLLTMDGDMSLHEQHGKVVILNFWASWCVPCQTEMPHFQKFYDEHADDVEILAVNVTKKDDRNTAMQFAQEYGLTFPILFDDTGEVSEMYGAFTIPTTYILNRDGEIVHQFAGPLNEEMLEMYTKELF